MAIKGYIIMVRAFLLGMVILVSSGLSSYGASENDWFVPLGKPPEAPPKRISGGEGMAPLPLPATPLRRTERKRQPTPPALFGKVVCPKLWIGGVARVAQ